MPLSDYAETVYRLSCYGCSTTDEFESERQMNRSSWVEHNNSVYCSDDCAYDGCECDECNPNDEESHCRGTRRSPGCGCAECRAGRPNSCLENEATEVR